MVNTKAQRHAEKASVTRDSFRFRYETLRALINRNGEALRIMSDIEADLNYIRQNDQRMRMPIRRLFTEVLLMAQELNLLTSDRYAVLHEILFRLKGETERLFAGGAAGGGRPLAVVLSGDADPSLVGGKAAGLSILLRHLEDHVPPAFVVTTEGYRAMIEKGGLDRRIRLMMTDLDVTADPARFSSVTATIRRWILEAPVPEELEREIAEHAGRIASGDRQPMWAVRSSAVCEDGEHSFAGQFESVLNVATGDLVKAYKEVIASRFTDRAVSYRLNAGCREVDTPMAVIFMPMVDPAAAGVIYTAQAEKPDSGLMTINSVPGLADRMVRGEVGADTFVVSKEPGARLVETLPANSGNPDYLTPDKVLEIAALAVKAVGIFGHELDIEWAVDRNGKAWLLQARRLTAAVSPDGDGAVARRRDDPPILEGGVTIFPGRAEGPVYFLEKDANVLDVPEGCVLVSETPRLDIALVLPKMAALLVIEGNPVGHLAALAREFAVPTLFRLGERARMLATKNVLSVNATKRAVYSGVRWPGMRERVLARIAAAKERGRPGSSGPLYELVFGLNLVDPDAPSFKAKNCRSIHDSIRFIHEMAVRSMFGFGDRQKRRSGEAARELVTALPIKLYLIDLDGCTPSSARKVSPSDVGSIPFRALWRGLSDERLPWAERWEREMRGMPGDFKEAVLGGNAGPRRASDANYVMAASDYLNINARVAYHYVMVDAMVGEGAENNHIHFRFRGGGASGENRARRARFLESVLRQSGFGVDRRGDLLAAWLRRYPRGDSENALELLGRLMVCARQLDVVMTRDVDVDIYTAYFLSGRYDVFA